MKVLVAGDYCPRERIAHMLEHNDYSFFDEVKEIISQADYSIVNFECPIVDGNVEPIKKIGPTLRTTSISVDAIRYAGFDCVTLANNHFRDFGDVGCITTLNELKKQKFDFVGGGENIEEAQQILYKKIFDNRLAIVNFCENEFSIATENSSGAAPLDTVDNYFQITEARRNADYVLVIVHGGHELYQLPSPRMKKLYRYFIELGADAVVNHHQHCYSGYEYYNEKPILYGLGNFCFDKNGKSSEIWNEGYFVTIEFDNSSPQISIYPYKQCESQPNVRILKETELLNFYNKLSELNEIISNDNLLNDSFLKWVENRRRNVLEIFSSYHNRYLNAAANRGWIPRPMSLQEVGSMLNYVACESHRDIVIKVLSMNLNNE